MKLHAYIAKKTSCMKRRLALQCCRAEQKMLDLLCDTPPEFTPNFIMCLQTIYMQRRIDALLQKKYQESRTRWKEAYPDPETKTP